MSLRLVQCSEYTGDTGAMAFTFDCEYGYQNVPTVTAGDADATGYASPGYGPPYTTRGVRIERPLRPGWWSFDYSYSTDGGNIILGWSIYNASGLGDTSSGSDVISTSDGVPGSGTWLVRAVSVQGHACAGLLFAAGISTVMTGTLTVTGTWLACPACAEPV